MRFGFERIFGELAYRLDEHVFILILAQRRGWIGEVGDQGHDAVELGFHLPQALVECGNPVAYQAHGFDPGLALGGVLHTPDLFGGGVALPLQGFNFLDQEAALLIQL